MEVEEAWTSDSERRRKGQDQDIAMVVVGERERSGGLKGESQESLSEESHKWSRWGWVTWMIVI
jgi:hypothetical protein